MPTVRLLDIIINYVIGAPEKCLACFNTIHITEDRLKMDNLEHKVGWNIPSALRFLLILCGSGCTSLTVA